MKMATSNQHKQTVTKPYTKGFNAGAVYAFGEYKVLFAWYIQELHKLSSRDSANVATLRHITALHKTITQLQFPEFIGEAPDRRKNNE
jgi:hypothetical protein